MQFESRLDETMNLLQTVIDDMTELLLERYDDVKIQVVVDAKPVKPTDDFTLSSHRYKNRILGL
ncbi:hypothetical protein [Alicyclobacillus fastidiosus]|uniref:Uncharacterized protein n=1 Tax=Alicyclobacillus fastidiosus TaxID=392011 RepID=A0ABV5AKC8_9BACL|nr:hypothetical protein [Alicyclobacillus fastidiosus]WEH09308.1 hypothetical protein PYS47_21970 [Alicyclobacillus fastidiosus]